MRDEHGRHGEGSDAAADDGLLDDDAERAQVRGGTLLFTGRMLAVGINFLTQVLIVRSLSKTAYGAFAYGLSVATLGETLVTLGLDRGITRFVPIFQERGERAKAAGTIALVVGTVCALGIVFVLAVALFGDTLTGPVVEGDRQRDLLLILVLLAPIQALDNLAVGIFAVYGRPGSIFVRRFVLGPVLRLVVVVLVIAGDQDVFFLATGYVVAGAVGMALYVGVVVRLLGRDGVLHDVWTRRAQLPWREVLAFTVPLLSGDVVAVLSDSVGAIVLGQVGESSDVASFRAVVPVARLNQLAMASFGVLFTPLAARRFARGDDTGVARLYWQTTAFVAVVTFPVFALTFSLAGSVTVGLFGDRYDDAGVVLAALSLGFYVSSVFGFNGLTLNVFGQVRAALLVNLLTAVVSVALTVLLIPAFGAVGAGVASGGSLIVLNVLRQVAMARTTTVPPFDRSIVEVCAVVVVAAAGLLALEAFAEPSLPVALVAAAAVSVPVFAVGRRTIALDEAFPALVKMPLLRRLVLPPEPRR